MCQRGFTGIYTGRCVRDPGKLYDNFCYTYVTKDQHPPINSNLVECLKKNLNAPRPSNVRVVGNQYAECTK